MKIFKGHFWSPVPSVQPVQPVPPVPSNKTFSRFQKGLSPPLNLKPPVPLPTPIKCKVKTIGPLSGSAAQSPSGGQRPLLPAIHTFSMLFQKNTYIGYFWRTSRTIASLRSTEGFAAKFAVKGIPIFLLKRKPFFNLIESNVWIQ